MRRANPWPALVDLFSALLLPVFGGLILLSAEMPSIKTSIEELKKRLAQVENENNSLKKMIKVVKQRIGTDAATPENLTIAFDEYIRMVAANARRGKAKCQNANTLVYVSLLDGQLKVRLRKGVENLVPVGRFVAGQTLTESQQIDSFLLAVEQYHATHGDCRFDYRLIFKTDSDYRRGRSRFELYFYPENILSTTGIAP